MTILKLNNFDLEKIEADPLDKKMYVPSKGTFTSKRELSKKRLSVADIRYIGQLEDIGMHYAPYIPTYKIYEPAVIDNPYISTAGPDVGKIVEDNSVSFNDPILDKYIGKLQTGINVLYSGFTGINDTVNKIVLKLFQSVSVSSDDTHKLFMDLALLKDISDEDVTKTKDLFFNFIISKKDKKLLVLNNFNEDAQILKELNELAIKYDIKVLISTDSLFYKQLNASGGDYHRFEIARKVIQLGFNSDIGHTSIFLAKSKYEPTYCNACYYNSKTDKFEVVKDYGVTR